MKVISKVPIWMIFCLFTLSSAESSLTPALPSIAKEIAKGDQTLVQLASGMYFLGFATGIIVLGRLSDLLGRKPVLIFGLIVHLCSSIFSSITHDIYLLIAIRFVQAFGASVCSVIAQAMARDSYSGYELTYVYTCTSIAISFMPCIASVTGGYIVEYYNWRGVFVFLATLCSITLLLSYKIISETNPYIGGEAKYNYSMLFKSIIKNKSIWLYAIIMGSFNGMMFGFYIEGPFIFIEKLGLTPSEYGKLILGLSVANLAGGLTNRYLVKKYFPLKYLMYIGLTCSLVGCTALYIGYYYSNFISNPLYGILLVFTPMMLQLFGHNFVAPVVLQLALEDYRKVSGSAGAVFGLLYYLIVALVTFIISKTPDTIFLNFSLIFILLSFASFISFSVIRQISNNEKLK